MPAERVPAEREPAARERAGREPVARERAGREPAGPAELGTEPADAGEPEGPRSRRFPSVTRDTARPEGGGRAAPGDAPAPARQWPMLSVLAATAVGLLVTALGHPRAGCLLIGLALIAGSVMRWLLPSVGMLAVRSRFTDMVTYGLLGAAITLLALVMEPKPWLHIPFLETAVRFTVR
ncbi:DUF3017 domain-containing protein [Streptomyces sp. NPDC002104]